MWQGGLCNQVNIFKGRLLISILRHHCFKPSIITVESRDFYNLMIVEEKFRGFTGQFLFIFLASSLDVAWIVLRSAGNSASSTTMAGILHCSIATMSLAEEFLSFMWLCPRSRDLHSSSLSLCPASLFPRGVTLLSPAWEPLQGIPEALFLAARGAELDCRSCKQSLICTL